MNIKEKLGNLINPALEHLNKIKQAVNISQRKNNYIKCHSTSLKYSTYNFYFRHKKYTLFDVLIFNENMNKYTFFKNTFPDFSKFVEYADLPIVLKELKNDIEDIADDRLVFAIKLEHFRVNKEELLYYSNLDQMTYIPLMDKEEKYNFDYNKLSRKDKKILKLSGYYFLHVPYFAMKGKTHDLYLFSLNSKAILDASSRLERKIITFNELLKTIYKSL